MRLEVQYSMPKNAVLLLMLVAFSLITLIFIVCVEGGHAARTRLDVCDVSQ